MNFDRIKINSDDDFLDDPPICVPSREPFEDELFSIRKKIDKALKINNRCKERLEDTCKEQKLTLKDLTDKVIILLKKEKMKK